MTITPVTFGTDGRPTAGFTAGTTDTPVEGTQIATLIARLDTLLSYFRAEDAASADGQIGLPTFGVQRASPADSAAEGDYTPLQSKDGGLYVRLLPSVGLPAGANLIGDVAPAQRAITNGLTSARVISAGATTNPISVKPGAGRIARIDLFNNAAATRYFKIYNKSAAPTVGTDTPVWTIPLPPGTGFSSDFNFGKFFSIGIAYAITAAVADGDTTAIAIGDVIGSIDWI